MTRTPMHVVLTGPVATQDLLPLAGQAFAAMPPGYPGAPLMATLAAALLERGHRVTMISMCPSLPCHPGGSVRRQSGALELVYVPMRWHGWRPNGWKPGHILDLFRLERRMLRQEILRAGPDVVHAHWSYEFAWAAIDTGLPHVVTCHDSPFRVARFNGRGVGGRGYWRLKSWMAWHVLRRARCVTAVSPYLVDEVEPLCRPRVHLVPNPVSLGRQAKEAQQGKPAGCRRILMVCNGWGERKNPQPALVAFGRIAQAAPQTELVLAGHDFGEGGIAQRWCAENGISGRLRFVGPVSHEGIAGLIAGSDLLLHPALEESFGMVAAEALLAGVPVVGGAHSGALPWVVGAAGRLVDVSSPESMASAVLELLADDALRARLGAQGRDQMESRFSVSAVISAYEDLYRQVRTQVSGAARPLQGSREHRAWS